MGKTTIRQCSEIAIDDDGIIYVYGEDENVALKVYGIPKYKINAMSIQRPLKVLYDREIARSDEIIFKEEEAKRLERRTFELIETNSFTGDIYIYHAKHREDLKKMKCVAIIEGELCNKGECEWCDELRSNITNNRVF